MFHNFFVSISANLSEGKLQFSSVMKLLIIVVIECFKDILGYFNREALQGISNKNAKLSDNTRYWTASHIIQTYSRDNAWVMYKNNTWPFVTYSISSVLYPVI